MEKIVIDFSGKGTHPSTQSIEVKPFHKMEDITLEVSRAVDEARQNLLRAKKNGIPVTLILPDHGVTAAAIVQAVRGLIGRTPFVQSLGTEEVDIESIREAFRESLSIEELEG